MEITFEKVNNEYIAEFEITTDSNLHIEKKCASSTKLYQRTNGGGWDLVDETKNMQGAVDDFDLSALVYPKFIKVVCNAEPLYAEVTTSGEVTEIKSQSKEVEVTANGTTDVTPDAGFAYLNSVKVKTNVAGSGEGGADEWIVAVANEDNPNVNVNIVMLVWSICNLNFFKKGDCLQIARDASGNKFVTVITPLGDVLDVFNGSVTLFGGAIRIGATMNDFGDGKVRTLNNKEDYKNILLELSLMSEYDVTMADVESSVIFLSQNELMSMMSNGESL